MHRVAGVSGIPDGPRSRGGRSAIRYHGYKGSIFCLIVAALFALFLVVDLDAGSGPARARGLAAVQYVFRWLLVEPLGDAGAAALVMAIGIGFAAYVRPKH